MTGVGHDRIADAAHRFRNELRIPAVGAALIDRDAQLDVAVVGTRRRDRPDPVTVDDQWHIGSCAKAITAALYAQLVQHGDTRWSRPVSDLFADAADDIDAGWAAVTIDDVFHCRAGIRPNPTPAAMNAGWADTSPLTDQRRAAALDVLRHPPAKPGRFVYSNLGYILAGAAIDRITATSYEHTLHTLILDPLQLTSAGFGPPPAICGHRSRLQLAGLLAGRGDPAPPDQPTSDNPPIFNPAGRLHLTLPDWATLQRRLWLDTPDRLLTLDSVEHLLRLPDSNGMAMGWVSATKFDGASLGMQGSNTYWAATALLDHHRHRAALVIANDGRNRVLARSAHVAGALLRTTGGLRPDRIG